MERCLASLFLVFLARYLLQDRYKGLVCQNIAKDWQTCLCRQLFRLCRLHDDTQTDFPQRPVFYD